MIAELDEEPAAREKDFAHPVVLADFGSTFTKLTIVDAATGTLIARASHPTSVRTDVLDGFDAALGRVADEFPRLVLDDVKACSSAGGGLRLGVVGLEKDLTAEAGRRAALSAGARVVTVMDGGLADGGIERLLAEEPDILLLTGGTDGGNRACLIESASRIASSDLLIPVVVAGNIDAQEEARRILHAEGRRHVVLVPNVMPEIGRICEEPVREVIRELFIRHVIGGKHLSARSAFTSMVSMPTPEAVLLATQLLADPQHRLGFGDVAVIDIGGATTDIHSAVRDRPGDEGGYTRQILPSSELSRTVEGDLGLRWNAPGVVEAALAEPGTDFTPTEGLSATAERLRDEPDFLPSDDEGADDDAELASLATRIALQRHAGELKVTLSPDGASLRRTGKDLRSVQTMIGTGGIFAHATPARLARVLSAARSVGGGRKRLLPRQPDLVVDRSYVMAAAGLLSVDHPNAAARLLHEQLAGIGSVREGTSDGH